MLPPDRRLVLRASAMALVPGLLLGTLLWWPELPSPWEGLALLDPRVSAQRKRGEQYDRVYRAVERRTAAKEAVARDLAAGRLTLLEAAARARAIDRACPEFSWKAFRSDGSHASDEERHCREVIERIRAITPLDDPAHEDIARRYEAELRERIAHGTLHLPETEAPPLRAAPKCND